MSTPLKIVADQQITQAKEAFAPFGDLQLFDGRKITANDLINADVLLVRSVTQVNEALLANTAVKFVGSATAGVDHVDTEYLQANNICFHYAPGSNARSVAEYVLTSLLYLAKESNFELQHKTLGIVGVGHVGSTLYELMASLGVKCLLNDPVRAEVDSTIDWVDIDQISQADIISFHVPLTEDVAYATRDMVNSGFLKKLKEDVIFINTSRGGIVRENDLLDFIAANAKAKLVLDVWQHEPLINEELLEKATIATPHIAGYSFDGKLKATCALQTILSAWSGIKCQVINADQYEQYTIDALPENDLLYHAALLACDLLFDTTQLKHSITVKESQRGQFFDNLRKTYRVRREFDQVLIKHEQHNAQLRKLGFRQLSQ